MSGQPTTMRAFVIDELKKGRVQPGRPVPKLEAGFVLVKVSHVALNPTDWKHLDLMGNRDSILGCDYSGTVSALGDGTSKFKVGDRVCGPVHGGKFPERGSFAEYLVVKEDMTMAVPKQLGDAEASTYGVAFCTAAMAVFHAQGYSPTAKDQKQGWVSLFELLFRVPADGQFLVSGGSTSVGLFTLAILRHLGIKSIATASPHSFDLVRSFGADHVVDYHDKEAAVQEIKSVTGGGVVGGLECVGGDDNYYLAAHSFVEGGGDLTTLTLIPDSANDLRKEVKIARILLYTVFGYSFEFLPGKPPLPYSPEDNAWFRDFVKFAEGDSGLISKIKANPVDLRSGGLNGILEGLDLLRQNKVSGKKLVYKVA